MNNCGGNHDHELIRDEILKMVQEGILQGSVRNCDGGRIGQWAEVLVCGATGPTPPSGVDKNTRNKELTWNADSQDVVVTDTAGNQVSAKVVFDIGQPPPTGDAPLFSDYIGEDVDTVLTEPGAWMLVKAVDNKVYKLPVYFNDVVSVCAPINVEWEARELLRTRYLMRPATGELVAADKLPASVSSKFEALDLFSVIEDLIASGVAISPEDYIYTTLGWVNYSEVAGRNDGAITLYSIIWDKTSSGAFTKSLEFPRYRLKISRGENKAELFKISGEPAPCGTPYPKFKILFHGYMWYESGCTVYAIYRKHEVVIPIEELVGNTVTPDADYSAERIMENFKQRYAKEYTAFSTKLKKEADETAKEQQRLHGSWWHYGTTIGPTITPFGIIYRPPYSAEYVYHAKGTSVLEEPQKGYIESEGIGGYTVTPLEEGWHAWLLADWRRDEWLKKFPNLGPM